MAIERRKLSTLIALAVISSFFVNSTNADACDPNPCKNGGRCSEDFDGEAECRCRNKFFGKTCLDACEDNSDFTSCGDNGKCEHKNCTCTSSKYFGPHCEEKCEDSCKGDHTKCVLEPGMLITAVTCECDGELFLPITNTGFAADWEGCRKVNCTDNSHCSGTGTCNSKGNCECDRTVSVGDQCEHKCNPKCDNKKHFACMLDEDGDPECHCEEGYTLADSLTECYEVNCATKCPKADSLTCAKDGNGFKCTCLDDTFSPNDIRDILKGCFKDPCKTSPCGKNGNCQTISDTEYRCFCDSGYYGVHCSEKCIEKCGNNSLCNYDPTSNTLQCQCRRGFIDAGNGKVVCVQNLCNREVCQNGGTCAMSADGKVQCDCPSSHTGDFCQCLQNPCTGKPCGSAHCVPSCDTHACRCTKATQYWDGTQCIAGRLPIYILQKTINIENCINCNVSK